MFDGETGHVPTPRRRGLSAFTAPAAEARSFDQSEALRLHNLRLAADGAHHRWVVRNGKTESVTVTEPVFGEMDERGCRPVVGVRPASGARCNGDGTVSVGWFSHKLRQWVFGDAGAAQ